MTKEQFLLSSAEFFKINGLNAVDLSEWFDWVEESHDEIRKLIGGTTKLIEHKIEPKKLVDKSMFIVKPIISDLMCDFYEYIEEYQLSTDKLKEKTIDGVKTQKHFMTFVNKRYKENPDKRKMASKMASELGQVYALVYLEEPLDVLITTEPLAFMNLAHYGCDAYSCFKSKIRERFTKRSLYKFNLGTVKNSFVALIGNFSKGLNYNRFKAKGRFFGWYDPKQKALNACNLYTGTTEYSTHKGIVEIMDNSCKILCKDIGVEPELQTSSSIACHQDNCVWINARNIKTFAEEAYKQPCKIINYTSTSKVDKILSSFDKMTNNFVVV